MLLVKITLNHIYIYILNFLFSVLSSYYHLWNKQAHQKGSKEISLHFVVCFSFTVSSIRALFCLWVLSIEAHLKMFFFLSSFSISCIFDVSTTSHQQGMDGHLLVGWAKHNSQLGLQALLHKIISAYFTNYLLSGWAVKLHNIHLMEGSRWIISYDSQIKSLYNELMCDQSHSQRVELVNLVTDEHKCKGPIFISWLNWFSCSRCPDVHFPLRETMVACELLFG